MLNYKSKLQEIVSRWFQYRALQNMLVTAREKGDVTLVTDILGRINKMIKEMDEEIAPVMNAIKADIKEIEPPTVKTPTLKLVN